MLPPRLDKKLKDFRAHHGNNPLILSFETVRFFLWGAWTILRAYLIFRRLPAQGGKKSFTVIMPTIPASPIPGLVYFDAIFAHAFRLCGARPFILFADGALASTDTATASMKEWPQKVVSRTLGPFLKRSLHVPCHSYWEFISKEKIEAFRTTIAALPPFELESYTYRDVPVGLHAKAAAIRFFLEGALDLQNSSHVQKFREKLLNAMITTEVAAQVVQKEKPSLLFFVHGVYSAWGPWYDYFRSKGIDTIIYGAMTLRFGTFMFNRNTKMNEIASAKAWQVFQKKPLTALEENAIDDYFRGRVQGHADDQNMYKAAFAKGTSVHRLQEQLFAPAYKRRYVLYANLVWDVAIEGRISDLFDDAFSWLDEHIAFFKAHPSYQLIIKPHPHELWWEKTRKGIYEYVTTHHAPLPPNIIVLKPNVPLNAYQLFTKESIALIFNGTLGFELATLGFPVLVAAKKIHYYEAGIVPRIPTKKEYFALLDNPAAIRAFANAHHKLAKKYAYFYLFRSIVDIPFYRRDKWSTIDWRAVRDTKSLFSANSPVMRIVQKAINRQDIVNPL